MESIKKFSADSQEKIAKHVKIYFEGSVEIIDLGRFYFEQGKMRIPADATKTQYTLVTSVNQILKSKTPIVNWEV